MTNPDDLSLPELWGMRIYVTESLPTVVVPDHAENVRRMVRHSCPSVYPLIGEEVGPKPGEVVIRHSYIMGDTLFISKEAYDKMSERIRAANRHGKLN